MHAVSVVTQTSASLQPHLLAILQLPLKSLEDEPVGRLTRGELERVVRAESLRPALRNAHLQELVRRIDSSDAPEAELKKALELPDLREFADQLLLAMDPSHAEAC
eukprot:jgi/Chlat1/3055/Chrsp21S03317